MFLARLGSRKNSSGNQVKPNSFSAGFGDLIVSTIDIMPYVDGFNFSSSRRAPNAYSTNLCSHGYHWYSLGRGENSPPLFRGKEWLLEGMFGSLNWLSIWFTHNAIYCRQKGRHFTFKRITNCAATFANRGSNIFLFPIVGTHLQEDGCAIKAALFFGFMFHILPLCIQM